MAGTDLLLQALRGAGYNVSTNPDGSTSAAPLPTVTQAAAQNPKMSDNVLAAITGSAQAVTPDIVVAGDSSQTTPRFDNSTGFDESFAQQNANAPTYGGGSLQANARAAAQSRDLAFKREQLGEKQNQDSVANMIAQSALALKARESNVRTAQMITNLALERRKQDDQLKTHFDTAGLLQSLNTLHHDDPEYDQKLGAALANYSRYDQTKIAPILEAQKAARAQHFEGMKLGGASQYSPEAQSVFQDATARGASPFEAHAAAKGREQNIKSYNDAVSKGHLTEADRPNIVDANGILDYGKAATVAAQNAGKVSGATQDLTERGKVINELAVLSQVADRLSKSGTGEVPQALTDEITRTQARLQGASGAAPIVRPKTGADYTSGL